MLCYLSWVGLLALIFFFNDVPCLCEIRLKFHVFIIACLLLLSFKWPSLTFFVNTSDPNCFDQVVSFQNSIPPHCYVTYFSWFSCSSVSPKADLKTSILSAMHSSARLLVFSFSDIALPVCEEERKSVRWKL